MKYLTVLLILSMVVTGIALARQQDKNTPLMVGYMKLETYDTLLIAEEKGYFKEEGLDVELILIPSAQVGLDALIAEKLDLTANPLIPALNLEQNLPGKVKILAMKYSDFSCETEPYRFIVKSDSAINTLADLRGKKLAVTPTKSQIITAKIVLQKFVNPDEVTIINLPPQEHLIALQNGGVDVAMTLEPVGTVALVQGGFKELDFPSRGELVVNPFYGSSTTLSSGFMKKYPNGAKKVQRAIEKAVRFSAENERERRDIIKKYTGVTPEVAQKMKLQPNHLANEVNKEALQKATDFLFEKGLIKGNVKTSDMLL